MGYFIPGRDGMGVGGIRKLFHRRTIGHVFLSNCNTFLKGQIGSRIRGRGHGTTILLSKGETSAHKFADADTEAQHFSKM